MFKKVNDDTWKGRIYGVRKFSAGGYTFGWAQNDDQGKC